MLRAAIRAEREAISIDAVINVMRQAAQPRLMGPVAAIVGVGCIARCAYDICPFCEAPRPAFGALARVVSGFQRALRWDPITDTDSMRQPTPTPRGLEFHRNSTASCQEMRDDVTQIIKTQARQVCTDKHRSAVAFGEISDM